ncbi:hypothetical protein [Endozoicomonas sp.]|uniref:hypothetical protein n=1 Tax=Endozoicomonas sp. TaxID=1892382 RepID=UPI00383ADC53
MINKGSSAINRPSPLRESITHDPQTREDESTIIPKPDTRPSHLIRPIDKMKVVCVELQPQILDKILLNQRIPCRTRFFLECLCNDELNASHMENGSFKMLIQDINEDFQLQENIEKELRHRFSENYEEGIRTFFTTYHNNNNVMRSLQFLAARETYRRFYSPLDFIKGILDNILSGRPIITSVDDSTLHIEYKPLKKSEIKVDWKTIDKNPDHIQGSIVTIRKDLLTSPATRIESKQDLDKWFLMIKKALPVIRIDNGCTQRCAFAESLLSLIGLETRIVTINPAKDSKLVKFNPDSTNQLDVRWLWHRVCAVKLPGSDELYILDFPYEETIPLSMHPNIYSGNQWKVGDPDENPEPESRDESYGYSTISFLQEAWRNEQISDRVHYAPDKPWKTSYHHCMTWDKQNRQWQHTEGHNFFDFTWDKQNRQWQKNERVQ